MKKYWNDWKATILIGVGVFVLALLLRLYNLDLLPIFGDEAIYIRWSQVMGAVPGLRFLPLSDGKQPLFMWVLMFLVRRFSDPLFIGRLTSVFYGTGTLVGIFVLTYYLIKDKKVALIASFIYAISPYGLFFDRMALVDSMLTMFGVWTLFLGVVTSKSSRFDFALLTGFSLGGALLTKSPAIYFAILLPTTWFVSNWPKKNKLVHLIKLASLLAVTLVIAYGLYNILRLGENFQMLAVRNNDYIYSIDHIAMSPFDPFIPFMKQSFEWFWLLGPSTFIFLVFLGIFLNLKKKKSEIILLSSWTFLPVAVSAEFARVFTARYIVFVVPMFVILAGIAFVNNKYRNLVIPLFIFFVLHALWIDGLILKDPQKVALPRTERSGYLEEWTSGYGIREVSEIIREDYERNPEEKIVVGTEGYFGTLPDGLQAYLNDLPEITVIGVGLPIQQVPIQLVESRRAGNKTYLVVNSTRFVGKADELGLKLLAIYPKAFRPDGSRETLLFFQVTDGAGDF